MVIGKEIDFNAPKISYEDCINNLPLNTHMAENSNDEPIEHHNKATHKHGKKKKKLKQQKDCEIHQCESSNSEGSSGITSISRDDLIELKSVYNKCKSVMRRIETKYGHLLSLNDSPVSTSDIAEQKCECKLNKKIIFGDDGQEITTETATEHHVCHKRLKRKFSDTAVNTNNLQVEYEAELELPNDIETLTRILEDPTIEITYRNKLINKMKSIKQELTDDIKFNKKSIVENVKLNAEEIFEFKGANLSNLPGYLY